MDMMFKRNYFILIFLLYAYTRFHGAYWAYCSCCCIKFVVKSQYNVNTYERNECNRMCSYQL